MGCKSCCGLVGVCKLPLACMWDAGVCPATTKGVGIHLVGFVVGVYANRTRFIEVQEQDTVVDVDALEGSD